MQNAGLSFLVIEEQEGGAIERTLAGTDLSPAQITRASTMKHATELLDSGSFDVICVDLSLPDAHGLATVSRIRAVAENVPLIVFCDELDGPMAIQAVHVGAQDYVIKDKEGPEGFTRSVNYSIAAIGARMSLAYLAQHDPVTGLVNRSLFEDRLSHALVRAVRHASTLAVLAVDIDDFSGVNSRFGSEIGDLILRQVATRLRQPLRKMDTLARSHDDVLLLIAEDVKSEEGASVVARKVLSAMEEPFDAGGTPVSLTVCIGMALYPEEAIDAEGLVENAARALAVAKRRGPGNAQRYGAPS